MPDPEVGREAPLRICSECGGLTFELTELNPILLHNNLPGIEALGGRAVPDGDVVECPTCHVDMTLLEGGDRQEPQFYEFCEECGRAFIAADSLDEGLDPEPKVVAFFRRFAVKKARPGP